MNRSLILVWILLCSTFFVSAQDKDSIVLVENDGVATYLNKNPQANFAVSFKGDTIYDSGVRSGAGMGFMVDSAFVQVTKYKIPEGKLSDKFNAKKEKALLDYFRNYELDYFQSEVFMTPLKNESVFFENSWGKQFQLWEFETPFLNRGTGDTRANDSVTIRNFAVRHNLFLSFVANNYVVMINMPVLEQESKEAKIALLKEQVANSIRIFAAPAIGEVLHEQQTYHKLGQEFSVQDSTEGIKFTIPYWLNVMQGPYYLHGVFPDVNNISNALLVMLIDKSRFTSFEDFKTQWLKRKNGRDHMTEVAKSKNDKLSKYNFRENTSYGKFRGQNVFFETKASYGMISFTATDDTFDKNISRFEEFLNKVEIEPF